MGVSDINTEHQAQNLNSQEIAHFFMEFGKLATYTKGVSIYTPGEAADKIFYVNHGEIKVSRLTNEGKEIILEILGPGMIFGDIEAIGGTDRKNTVVAKKDAILHYVMAKTLHERIATDKRLNNWLIKRLAQKQISTEHLMENLLFKSANAKVANILLELAHNYGVAIDNGVLIDYLITHQEIGNSIATTRETVSYAFMEFRQLGWIDTVKRKTVILDKAALESVAAD